MRLRARELAVIPLLTLGACDGGGKLGDACTVDEDCAGALVCHLHEGEDEGECDTEHHDDDDHTDEDEHDDDA